MILHRADLVPVYSFGENELFKQVIFSDGSLGRRLQDLFKKIVGFAPCLFVGERMAVVPYRTPITTVGEYFTLLYTSLTPCTEPILFQHSASSSGKSNLGAKVCYTHRGGGRPLSQTLHGRPVQIIPWTQSQLWTSWRSQASDYLDIFCHVHMNCVAVFLCCFMWGFKLEGFFIHTEIIQHEYVLFFKRDISPQNQKYSFILFPAVLIIHLCITVKMETGTYTWMSS